LPFLDAMPENRLPCDGYGHLAAKAASLVLRQEIAVDLTDLREIKINEFLILQSLYY